MMDSGMRRRRRSSWQRVDLSPASSSVAPNPGYRAPGTPGGRPFAPTEHLAPEAIAAFVDGELGMTPHMRAADHVGRCPECAAEVDAQICARTRLRAAWDMATPAGLLGQLAQIPTKEFDVPSAAQGSVASPGNGPDQSLGSLDAPGFPVHEVGAHRGRRMTRWWSR